MYLEYKESSMKKKTINMKSPLTSVFGDFSFGKSNVFSFFTTAIMVQLERNYFK